jgi:hypothetical protein
MPDRALEQHDEILRRRSHGDRPQLLYDRPRRMRPLRTLAVSQEPPCSQSTIDLLAQRCQVAVFARRSQSHVSLDITRNAAPITTESPLPETCDLLVGWFMIEVQNAQD